MNLWSFFVASRAMKKPAGARAGEGISLAWLFFPLVLLAGAALVVEFLR